MIRPGAMQLKSYKDTTIKVFDFFSGCGGTSKGFEMAGMKVVFALDNDPDAEQTFTINLPRTKFVCKDITKLKPEDIHDIVSEHTTSPILFCGCAPCQPFTKQKTKRYRSDKRSPLIEDFRRFIEYFKPEFIFVENVPGIQKLGRGATRFNLFVRKLRKLGYNVTYDIVAVQCYGVPQRRRRLVLIASKLADIEMPSYTHGPGTNNEHYSTVREWIGDLPPIAAGEAHSIITNHRAAKLSEKNYARIIATPEGGDRRNWPSELQLRCHSKGYSGHSDVYGRMRWDEPATGLTTRCTSLSNGRFGHPNQNRAISVREAACLQTFPRDFIFKGNLASMSRQIGNAVPVKLAEIFGLHFINHLQAYMSGVNSNGNL